MFHALELAVRLAEDLGPVLPTLRRRSKNLADQVERAAASIALNLAEGNGREGRNRLHFFRIARSSALEVHTALRLAAAYGYVSADSNASLVDRANRVCAILCRLTR